MRILSVVTILLPLVRRSHLMGCLSVLVILLITAPVASHQQIIFAQTGDSVDIFPLSPGVYYTYEYRSVLTIYDPIGPGQLGRSSDSGRVVYMVLDSTRIGDTLRIWSIEERPMLWHTAYFFMAYDSAYWDSTWAVKNLTEHLTGSRAMECSLRVWSFPRVDSSQTVHRYADRAEVFKGRTFSYRGTYSPAKRMDSLWFSSTRGLYRMGVRDSLFSMYTYTTVVHADLTEGPTGVETRGPDLPRDLVLFQNFPNPFNPTTTIRYALPTRSHMTLMVFNTLGQKVAELASGEIDAGYHEVRFDATDLASGVYFYRLQAGGFVETKKLLLLR